MAKHIKVNLNSDSNKRLVLAVLSSVLHGQSLGNMTEREAVALYTELSTESYRVKHGIRFKDFTPDDFANMAEDEAIQRALDCEMD